MVRTGLWISFHFGFGDGSLVVSSVPWCILRCFLAGFCCASSVGASASSYFGQGKCSPEECCLLGCFRVSSQGYWSYSKGVHEDQPGPTAPEYATWEQAAGRVMYCLATCVHDHMLSYIREAKTPKKAWENLRKIFAVNTNTRKLQIHQDLTNIQQRDMSITTTP